MWKGYLALVMSTVCLLIVVGLYSFKLHKKMVEYNEAVRGDLNARNYSIGGDLYSASNAIWDTRNSSSKDNSGGKVLKWISNPCVTSERLENSSTIQNCVPNALKDSRIRNTMILNQFLILTIGGGGNLLTLISVPYAYYKYQSSFPYLWLISK